MKTSALFAHSPSSVRIVEVGPRDGLQNEGPILSTADKLRFIGLLAESGLRSIEATSFVSPTRVPQLADADDLMRRISHMPVVAYGVLTANQAGLRRAIAAGATHIALFTAASETFTRRNIGMSIGESLAEFAVMAADARRNAMFVRAYVSTAFVCPFEGEMTPDRVLPVVERLLDIGADEVAVSDTIGHASPEMVARLTEALLPTLPLQKFAFHFHDTLGMALANVSTALQYGVAIYDSSAGGAGGCPFAPGAAGNLATEDLLTLLQAMGIETGVNRNKVVRAARFMRDRLAAAAERPVAT